MEQDVFVWQLKLFGGLRVSHSQRTIERFRTQKTAALLALLALKGSRSREEICAILWPDSSPEAARNSLSAALSSLRRDLGDEYVRADRTSVSLAPSSFQTDVAEFNEALRANDFARAIEFYSGPLLPGVHEDPFPSFAREYEEKARVAFNARLAELEDDGQPVELLKVARRAAALFGNEERWFLAQMRAHYGLDDFDTALRTYETLGRIARKNGETASESARLLAKTIRREREEASKVAEAGSGSGRGKDVAATAKLSIDPAPLPSQWTRFFGREAERAMLAHWLRNGEKLITLSGAGGSGKTRLSLETLRELSSDWDGYIVFVPLAALSDPDLIFPAIRDALGLTGAPDLAPLELLSRALSGRKTLLFLDNFEQLVQGGDARLQQLRERLPDAVILVTSRVLLQLPGEREFPVAPLPTPLQDTSATQLHDCASAALFCDRADLVLDEGNAGAIGALCRRLDGIPLALELAAARAKVLSPAEILERLQKHPDFLSSRAFGLPARHKTLRATIEWSTELLAPQLKSFWTRLAVFYGGWTLQAAEQVVAPHICEPWETLDFLSQLRECSLVLIEEQGKETRFRMLQTLREFGSELLSEREEVERSHFEFFLSLAQQASNAMQGPGQTAWLSRLDAEQDNLRAALSWARDHDPSRGLQLATALLNFWMTRLNLDEGRGWIETFLSATEHENEPFSEARSRAFSGAGRLAWHDSDFASSRALVEQGLQAAHQSGDPAAIVTAASSFVRLMSISGDVGDDLGRGRSLADEAVVVARTTGDDSLLLEALISRSYALLLRLDDNNVAREVNEEAVALSRQLRDELQLATALISYALVLYLDKNFDGANEVLDEAFSISYRLHLPFLLYAAFWQRCHVAREEGNFARSHAAAVEALKLSRANPGFKWSVSNVLLAAAFLLVRRGEVTRGVELASAAYANNEAFGYRLPPALRRDFDLSMDEARLALGEAEFELAWSRGRPLSAEQAIDLAMQW